MAAVAMIFAVAVAMTMAMVVVILHVRVISTVVAVAMAVTIFMAVGATNAGDKALLPAEATQPDRLLQHAGLDD